MMQQKLFLELAQPDENGISRWVNTTEFIGGTSKNLPIFF